MLRVHPMPVALVLWGLTFAAYALTGATTLQGTDSSEWVALSLWGGGAHPPGYPVYALLLRAWQALPLGMGPVAQASLLSAVLMSSGVTVFFLALRKGGGAPWWALACALGLAASPSTWRMAGVAEVPPLLLLNAAAVVLVLEAVRAGGTVTTRHGAALGALMGLGVAHHHTLALLLPWVLWEVLAVQRSRLGKPVLAGVGAGVAVVVGAWWVWWMAQGTDPRALSFSSVTGPADVWDLILRREYGTFRSSALSAGWRADAAVDLWDELVRSALLFVPLALWGVRGSAGMGLALTGLLCGPLLLGTFTVEGAQGAHAVGLDFRERFHVLPTLVFFVLAHRGCVALAASTLDDTSALHRVRALLPAVLLSATALGSLGTWADATWRGETAVEHVLRTAVKTLPPGAVVVVLGDAWQFGWPVAEALEGQPAGTHHVLAWPRSWTNAPLPPADASLFEGEGSCPRPCTGPGIVAHVEALAARAPVYFFPAQAAGTVLPQRTVDVEGVFSVLGPVRVSPAAQVTALDAFIAAHRAPTPRGDGRRTGEFHALASWGAPWLVLADTAHQAGDEATATLARARARQVMVDAAEPKVDSSAP